MRKIPRITRSIFIKFVLSFILVGLVPLIVLGYFLMDAFSTQSEHYNNSNLDQMTLYIAKNTEQVFAGYNTISKIMYEDNWYDHLSKLNGQYNNSYIDSLLKSIISMDPYLENVYYIPWATQEIQFQSRKAKVFDAAQFPQQAMTDHLKTAPTSLAFYPTHSETYFIGSNLQVMTFGRQLLDTSTALMKEPIVIGTLLFDVNIAVFKSVFSQIPLGPEDEIQMLDSGGTVNYSSNGFQIGQKLALEDRYVPKDKTTRVVKIELDVTEQELVGRFSRKDFFSTFVQFKGIIFIVLAVSIAALILLSLIFSRKFSRPIKDVMTQMSKMESGKLDISLPIKSEDELGQLTRGMNRMAKQLEHFIQDAYVAQIKQKQAELYALKSQIRPHYLYNTLEVIRMSAVTNDDMPVADMIHSLSSQLEYVLDYGENIVELSREIQNINEYFELVQVRYDDHVKLIIKVEDKVSLKWGVPKLSIQPLVENAVQHGIVPKDAEGAVTLVISIEEKDTLLIRIIDDGIGMSEQQARELNEGLQEYLSDRGGQQLGLKNVQDRVQSLFGRSYGIIVTSIPEKETSVQIRIPIIREVENYGTKRDYGG